MKKLLKNTHTKIYNQLNNKLNKEDVNNVTPGSSKILWWTCTNNHNYQCSPKNRTARSQSCPYCSGYKLLKNFNDLETINSELAQQLHPTLNSLKASEIQGTSTKKVWWLGKCKHEWKATVNSRHCKKQGCPYCSGQKTLKGFNDLETFYPLIAQQLHPLLNSLTASQVTSGSNRLMWWKCPKTHSYQCTVSARTSRNRGCPYCANKKVLLGFNDMETTHPRESKQWHPTLNGEKTPQHYTSGSDQKVWWKCQNKHEWKTSINARCKRGDNCPQCHTPQSKEEKIITELLQPLGKPTQLPLTFTNGRPIKVDSLHKNHIIEYDGTYWHKNKEEKDKEKTLILLNNGYEVTRVRNNLPPLNIDHHKYQEQHIKNLNKTTLNQLKNEHKTQ